MGKNLSHALLNALTEISPPSASAMSILNSFPEPLSFCHVLIGDLDVTRPFTTHRLRNGLTALIGITMSSVSSSSIAPPANAACGAGFAAICPPPAPPDMPPKEDCGCAKEADGCAEKAD